MRFSNLHIDIWHLDLWKFKSLLDSFVLLYIVYFSVDIFEIYAQHNFAVQAMARDRRNYYQETPKQIQKKIKKLKSIPKLLHDSVYKSASDSVWYVTKCDLVICLWYESVWRKFVQGCLKN